MHTVGVKKKVSKGGSSITKSITHCVYISMRSKSHMHAGVVWRTERLMVKGRRRQTMQEDVEFCINTIFKEYITWL